MTPINFGLKPMGRALRRAVSAVTFIFWDDFTTNESAPLASPRTAEPTGTGKLVDTGSIMSLSGGEMMPSATTTGFGDPSYIDNAPRTRSSGLAALFDIRNYSVYGSTANSLYCGWLLDDTPRWQDVFGFGFGSFETLRFSLAGSLSAQIGTYTDDTLKELFVIQRDIGYFFLDQENGKLLWADDSDTTSPVYAGAVCTVTGRSPFGLSTLRVSQLPAPWDTDYGIATDRLAGARTAGDTFTHEADFLGEFEQDTIPSSGQTEFAFRMQDASNYWQVTIDSSGDIDLDEVVAGSPTQRGSSAGVIANSDRIMIICDDETIKVYEANVLRITYSSAANFKTATAGKLIDEGTGGSVSDIISWPRTLSGTAKDALDAVADA